MVLLDFTGSCHLITVWRNCREMFSFYVILYYDVNIITFWLLSFWPFFLWCLHVCCMNLCETEIWAKHEFLVDAQQHVFSLFGSPHTNTITQWCGVGSRVDLFFPVWLSGFIRSGTLLTVCAQTGHVSSSPRADRPRSPLAHGCRSTHNSPVHSACNSQRLTQNFSVSVPTLIFTGTQRQGTI